MHTGVNMRIKDVTIQYCRESACPVQMTMDRHRDNGGSEEEIKLIKRAHCIRCDVWKLRKWMESHDLELVHKPSGNIGPR